ncbi:putative bifunctional diguanylate cyclase/phosphodiesterase [Pseudomonas syringae]|uniref:putative bifunctional diguanylate cyclase/phosphodiesterase n=1 Tax=Pseudomonas syringae TaxID=317 RepID=UPI003D7FD5B1
MHMTSPSKRFQKRLYPLLAFYLASLFLVSLAWEFKLENTAMAWLGLPYDSDFEIAERWRLVLTSTSFAMLSMLVPVILLRRLLGQLKHSYSELLAAQDRSDALARYDSLTGLLNRRVFNDLLNDLLQREQLIALFLLDLDNFKEVNDSIGHAAGDAVICAVAERLRDAGKSRQVSIARLGGDEFAIALTGELSHADLAQLAEDILSGISESITAWPAIKLSATLGIAIAPSDGLTPETLMQHAGGAMRRGKQAGRATFQFYEPSFEAQQREQAVFEQDLRDAVENQQIQPFYQPIVKLPEQSLCGFEILARWQHPTRGMIMPLEFIDLAEKLGLIKTLTQNLLLQTFENARTWPDTLVMAINVTSSMIEDPEFPEWLEGLAHKGNFALDRLEVEITESALVANVGSARQNLEAIRAMGVSVALDDFGTGYSGLYHLTQLSINKIKIDRSFLDSTLEKHNEMAMAILALGKSLNIAVTAEGVEDERIIPWLSDRRCDFAQGYFFGRPISSGSVSEMIFSEKGCSPLIAGVECACLPPIAESSNNAQIRAH